MHLALLLSACLAPQGAAVDPEPAPTAPPLTGSDGAATPGDPPQDRDGDTVLDVHEGESDPDGDGLPSADDLDSDGDGLLDMGEAGDRDPLTPPVDSDGDGLLDLHDLDSDGNCLPDSVEGQPLDGMPWDSDVDGTDDHADDDNDGDHISDVLELARDGVPGCVRPPDTDGDGLPDLNDLDSDGDRVDDALETAWDTDRDGRPNFRDLDSDGDGLPDEAEAGGSLSCFGASDADEDCVPDFRDADADNDGLEDGEEVFEIGSDPLLPDTDGDGASDLVELLAGSDPLVPQSSLPDFLRLPSGEVHYYELELELDQPATDLIVQDDPMGFTQGWAPVDAGVELELYGTVRENLSDVGHVLGLQAVSESGATEAAELIIIIPAMPAGRSCVPL